MKPGVPDPWLPSARRLPKPWPAPDRLTSSPWNRRYLRRPPSICPRPPQMSRRLLHLLLLLLIRPHHRSLRRLHHRHRRRQVPVIQIKVGETVTVKQSFKIFPNISDVFIYLFIYFSPNTNISWHEASCFSNFVSPACMLNYFLNTSMEMGILISGESF